MKVTWIEMVTALKAKTFVRTITEAEVQTNMANVMAKITNDDDAAFCCRFGVDRKADGCADTRVYMEIKAVAISKKGFHDMKTKYFTL